jgi:hypothetical protein
MDKTSQGNISIVNELLRFIVCLIWILNWVLYWL